MFYRNIIISTSIQHQFRLPQDYNVILVSLVNGLEVDERCYKDLQAMLDACRAEGLEAKAHILYR